MSANYRPQGKKFAVGDYVVMKNREGYIRYIGKREHHHGTWYGIELLVGQGPNDGSEHGKRYFSCKHKHGIFVRLYAIKKKLETSEVDPRRLNKSPLTGALPTLPQSTTLSENGSNPPSSTRSSDTSITSHSHHHQPMINQNPHHHHYNLKLSNHLAATGQHSRPGSTRASKKPPKLTAWHKATSSRPKPPPRPKSTRAMTTTASQSKKSIMSNHNVVSSTRSPKTPSLTPSLISSPRTIATPSPSVSPLNSPQERDNNRSHGHHEIVIDSPRQYSYNHSRQNSQNMKGSITPRIQGGHYKTNTVEIIDVESSEDDQDNDVDSSDSDERNLSTPSPKMTRATSSSHCHSSSKGSKLSLYSHPKSTRPIAKSPRFRFFGERDRYRDIDDGHRHNVVLPMDRASTISITDKISSVALTKKKKKSKNKKDKKEKRARSKSKEVRKHKSKSKERKKEKKYRGKGNKAYRKNKSKSPRHKTRPKSPRHRDHDRNKTDIDGIAAIFGYKKKHKKDKQSKKIRHMREASQQSLDMMDDEEMNEMQQKFNKRQSFHKRKSRTVDFALNAHRKDLEQIMRFRDEDKQSSSDDDDDLIENEQHQDRSYQRMVLPPMPTPQSPGKYTFRLHIKNPPKGNNNIYNKQMNGNEDEDYQLKQFQREYELQLSNQQQPVPLKLRQSYSFSNNDDENGRIGPHLSLAINDSDDPEKMMANIVGYGHGRARSGTRDSESSNIAHTYDVSSGHMPHDSQVESNKLGLLKKDLYELQLVPDTPLDSDNEQLDAAFNNVPPYGPPSHNHNHGHINNVNGKIRKVFLENKRSQALSPKPQRIIVTTPTPDNTSNGRTSNETDETTQTQDDILFISRNNAKNQVLKSPVNDNNNNMNQDQLRSSLSLPTISSTNPRHRKYAMSPKSPSFEIDEGVIEYHVPSANKKKKNQNIKINIHINNDIINSKKPKAMNKNGANQSRTQITTNDKTKQFSNSHLNITPNGHHPQKFTFNPAHIQSDQHRSQNRYEEQHEYPLSPKKKHNKHKKKNRSGHRYSRSSMNGDLVMRIPNIHHTPSQSIHDHHDCEISIRKKKQKKKKSKRTTPKISSSKKHNHSHSKHSRNNHKHSRERSRDEKERGKELRLRPRETPERPVSARARSSRPSRPTSTRASKKKSNKKSSHHRQSSRTNTRDDDEEDHPTLHRCSSKTKRNCSCHKHRDPEYPYSPRDRSKGDRSPRKHNTYKSSSKSRHKDSRKDKKSNKHQIKFRSKSGKSKGPIPPISPRVGYKRHEPMQQTYDWTGLV